MSSAQAALSAMKSAQAEEISVGLSCSVLSFKQRASSLAARSGQALCTS